MQRVWLKFRLMNELEVPVNTSRHCSSSLAPLAHFATLPMLARAFNVLCFQRLFDKHV